MRRDRYRRTRGFDGEEYSPELIRKYEDPQYAKAAAEYEREAMKRAQNRGKSGYDYDSDKGGRGDRSRKNRKKAQSANQKQYKFSRWRLVRSILIILLLIFVMGSGAFFYLTRTFDIVDTGDSDFAITDQVATDLSGYRNIAILGVDARAGESIDGSRTDAIIVMSINKSSGDIKLISVMRDSYLQMEYLDGSTILDKITHAHHYSGGLNTITSLNQSLDLNIEEFVIFNWQAVSDAVDCLGGIEIDISEDEIADMNTYGPETARNVGGTYTKITEAGTQLLDGVQATTYCRIRKTSGGDEGRSRRYKKVMAAVMKKALANPTKIAELSEIVFPNVRTNMSQLEMYTAALGAVHYNIEESITWPENYYSGLLSDGISYVVPLTLESNVISLHEAVFDQENYSVSEICRAISNKIISDTGLQ